MQAINGENGEKAAQIYEKNLKQQDIINVQELEVNKKQNTRKISDEYKN